MQVLSFLWVAFVLDESGYEVTEVLVRFTRMCSLPDAAVAVTNHFGEAALGIRIGLILDKSPDLVIDNKVIEL